MTRKKEANKNSNNNNNIIIKGKEDMDAHAIFELISLFYMLRRNLLVSS